MSETYSNTRTKWIDWIVLAKSSQSEIEQVCWISALLTLWFKTECPFSSGVGGLQHLGFVYSWTGPAVSWGQPHAGCIVLCPVSPGLVLWAISPALPRVAESPGLCHTHQCVEETLLHRCRPLYLSPEVSFWEVSGDKQAGKWVDLDLLPYSLISEKDKLPKYEFTRKMNSSLLRPMFLKCCQPLQLIGSTACPTFGGDVR